MTGTVTGEKVGGLSGKRYTIDWKCDASGNVSAYFDTDLSLSNITGKIEFVETAPGEDGDLTTDLPTASYDITLLDDSGYDWLGGTLANRSGSVAEKVVPSSTLVLVQQRLKVVVANAGNAKRGRIVIGVSGL